MSVPAPVAVQDFEARSLVEVFASIPDPRKRRGVRYPLASLLSLIVIALLSGAENPEQISRFAACHPRLLALLGFRPPVRGRVEERLGKIPIPSNDMIARVFVMIDSEGLNERLAEWLSRQLSRRETVAVDGKCLCGQKGYVVSFFCERAGHVLWQLDVGEKENEYSALLPLLNDILTRLAKIRVITGDAAFCQKEIARLIVEKRRHYLLQLKAPHLTDVRLAEHSVEQLSRLPPLAETVEKKGASAERRLSGASSGATRR